MDQYFDGCHTFIDIVKNYTNEKGLVWCPCRKRVNRLWQSIGIIEAHIIDHGFNPLYKIWRYHREPDPIMDPVGHQQGYNTTDEILNVLEDVIGPTHELLVEGEHADNFGTKPL